MRRWRVAVRRADPLTERILEDLAGWAHRSLSTGGFEDDLTLDTLAIGVRAK